MLSSFVLLKPDAGGLLRALTQFSHLAADTIVNGSATAHMAPTDHADRKEHSTITIYWLAILNLSLIFSALQKQHFNVCVLLLLCRRLMSRFCHPAGLTENCRGCARESLNYLKDLKSKTSLQQADPASVRIIVQKILHLGQVRETTHHLWRL